MTELYIASVTRCFENRNAKTVTFVEDTKYAVISKFLSYLIIHNLIFDSITDEDVDIWDMKGIESINDPKFIEFNEKFQEDGALDYFYVSKLIIGDIIPERVDVVGDEWIVDINSDVELNINEIISNNENSYLNDGWYYSINCVESGDEVEFGNDKY